MKKKLEKFVYKLDKKIEKNYGEGLNSYIITIYSSNTLCIEGHKGILDYTDTEVNFKLNNNRADILGENLIIKDYDFDTAVVVGNISSVSVSSV